MINLFDTVSIIIATAISIAVAGTLIILLFMSAVYAVLRIANLIKDELPTKPTQSKKQQFTGLDYTE